MKRRRRRRRRKRRRRKKKKKKKKKRRRRRRRKKKKKKKKKKDNNKNKNKNNNSNLLWSTILTTREGEDCTFLPAKLNERQFCKSLHLKHSKSIQLWLFYGNLLKVTIAHTHIISWRIYCRDTKEVMSGN
jgi:hypothetical protein